MITGADIEELVFRAYRQARLAGRDQALPEDFRQVIDDFLPPHQTEVLRHMERLALNQCSSRRFVPGSEDGGRRGETVGVITT